MNIKCLIVEDEPLAADVISDFVDQVPFLELVAISRDAFSAMEILNTQTVDLIFLDIHLPKLKGLEFLATLKNPPQVIITTAYHEFALKSYDFNVIDYLLKPIEFSRFMIAVGKMVERRNNPASTVAVAMEKADLFFTVEKKKARITPNCIRYIESQREYLKIVTDNKTITTRYLISDLERELPEADFIRIHRSFIVAVAKIEYIDTTSVEIAGKKIPIGRSYKDLVFQKFGFKSGD